MNNNSNNSFDPEWAVFQDSRGNRPAANPPNNAGGLGGGANGRGLVGQLWDGEFGEGNYKTKIIPPERIFLMLVLIFFTTGADTFVWLITVLTARRG